MGDLLHRKSKIGHEEGSINLVTDEIGVGGQE